ncbi:MAG: tRNA preQ1(34) S-adenosylmethionine ribosyltransferase-isomerase QueA [Nitrospirota bacterium]
MLLADFDFPFDPELVATRPVEPRDQARLLLVPRTGGSWSHHRVHDLPALLRPNDLLVVNDTRVLAARLVGRKRPTGGKVELLLVKEREERTWEVLLKGKVEPGQVIELGQGATVTVLLRGAGETVVRFAGSRPVRELIEEVGLMPLPPYIKREPTGEDRTWYQTVFARTDGSIAAPTASLHFTERLLDALRGRGIGLATVTLHVGLGTFLPVKAPRVEEHRMLPERIVVPTETAETVEETKRGGGRIVAVGSTVARALEASAGERGRVKPIRGETDLFIAPGYRFQVIDALLTNFHLPRSTLLMLVSALAGVERLRAVYEEAVKERYRFYSYGDAMLIL